MAQPLMPHATAAWLVDNSSLTFEQIAEFCGLHILEVQAIADDTAATKLTGPRPDPRGRADPRGDREGAERPRVPAADVQGARSRSAAPRGRATRRFSKRQDKPDGIAWIIKNHPEVSDGQISKLIGTTRTTIAAIRDRSHWNMANITPKDPVTLGLTTQRELDAAVAKAAKAAGIAGADRHALRQRPRGADRAAAQRARAACARRRGRACRRPATRRCATRSSRASATRSRTRRANSRSLDLSRERGSEAAPWPLPRPTSAS